MIMIIIIMNLLFLLVPHCFGVSLPIAVVDAPSARQVFVP